MPQVNIKSAQKRSSAQRKDDSHVEASAQKRSKIREDGDGRETSELRPHVHGTTRRPFVGVNRGLVAKVLEFKEMEAMRAASGEAATSGTSANPISPHGHFCAPVSSAYSLKNLEKYDKVDHM